MTQLRRTTRTGVRGGQGDIDRSALRTGFNAARTNSCEAGWQFEEDVRVKGPRQLHYVTRGYLAGFTDTRCDDGTLIVTDLASGKQRPSTPEKSARQRDIYRLEKIEGVPRDVQAVETFFSRLEGPGLAAIKMTLSDRRVPEGTAHRDLMWFLAMQAMRVPGTIHAFEKGWAAVLKQRMWYATASREAWASLVQDLKAEGKEMPDVSHDEMRKAVMGDEYSVAWDQDTRMDAVTRGLPQLAEALGRRQWTVVHRLADGPEFICSDRPVSLTWNIEPPPMPVSLGFGMPQTSVQFPLSRDAALIGIFEDAFPAIDASPTVVGSVNACTAWYATRHVFSASKNFTVLLPDGTAGGPQDLVRLVAPNHQDSRPRAR